MARKQPKYIYLKVLQGCYDGSSWDDLVFAEEKSYKEMKEFRDDVRAYRENEPQYPHRVVRRREANPEYGKDIIQA